MSSEPDPSQPGDVCHLLRLPTETLLQLCDHLSDDDEALSNLRLTCRSLKEVPEQRLFETIYLDRLSTSLTFLQEVAQHPRLRLYVKEVNLELERPYAKLSREQWQYRLDWCRKHRGHLFPMGSEELPDAGEVPDFEQDPAFEDDTDVDELPADALAMVDSAWDKYELYFSYQIDLESYSTPRLASTLDTCFSRLAHISRFACSANESSKYLKAPPNGKWGRKSQVETWTWPDLFSLVMEDEPRNEQYKQYKNDSDVFKATYAVACTTALFQSDLSLSSVHLAVSWDILAELGLYWRPPHVLPAIGNLKTLALHTPAGPQREVDDEEDLRLQVITAAETMLLEASDLSHLELWNGIMAGEEYDSYGLLGLPLPTVHYQGMLGQLQSIDLTGTTCRVDDFKRLFAALARTLRRLAISAAVITGGFWVEVFEAIRTELTLSHLELTGYLDEDASVGGLLGGWHADVDEELEGGGESYLDIVKTYMLKGTDEKPWKTLGEEGAVESWKEAGDASFYYEKAV